MPIICFKGRILSRTGTLHAHSNIPNPRWMPGSEGGGPAATTQAHWWIDMHPTFVGRGKDKSSPSVGEIVTVEFVKGYTSAAGEFCGIFKDFYDKIYGADGLMHTAQGDLEVLAGAVTKFDAKANADGSFNCTVTFSPLCSPTPLIIIEFSIVRCFNILFLTFSLFFIYIFF